MPQRVWSIDAERPADILVGPSVWGAKGDSLRALHQAGLRVPPGFIITADACRDFLQSGRLPDDLSDEIDHGLQRLESVVGRKYGQDLTLAVRGGAAISLPGLLTTILHCGATEPGADESANSAAWRNYEQFLLSFAPNEIRDEQKTSPIEEGLDSSRQRCQWLITQIERHRGSKIPCESREVLRKSIEAVWQSWRIASDVARTRLSSLTDVAGTAVVVQAMIDADCSGVVFSRDPTAGDGNHVLIEAVEGLGTDLVFGRVTPFSICRDPDAPSHRELDRRQMRSGANTDAVNRGSTAIRGLDDRALNQLAMDARRIETALCAPVDVEWAVAGGDIWYLQARRIPAPRAISRSFSGDRRDAIGGGPQASNRFLVRHDLDESLPQPTPLTWSMWRQFMRGDGGYGRLLRKLGYAPSQLARERGFLELVGGRIYADIDRVREMFCTGFPLSFDRLTFLSSPRRLSGSPSRFDIDRLDPWFLLKAPWIAFVLLRAEFRTRRLLAQSWDEWKRRVLSESLRWVENEQNQDVSRGGIAAAVAAFHGRQAMLFETFAAELFLPASLATVVENRLTNHLRVALREQEALEVFPQLLQCDIRPEFPDRRNSHPSPSDDRQCIEPSAITLAQNISGDFELYRSVACSAPPIVRSTESTTTETQANSKADDHRRQASEEQSRILSNLEEQMNRAQATAMFARTASDLRLLWRLLGLRETARHAFVSGLGLVREAADAIGRLTGLGDSIYFLESSELDDVVRGRNLADLAEQRRKKYELQSQRNPPLVLGVGTDRQAPSPMETGAVLRGRPLSGGEGFGTARHWNGRDEVETHRGEVLVAATVGPAAMARLQGISGIVVDEGGVLSHAAIWARNLGIPVVQCGGASGRIKAGVGVRVDGTRGIVVVERPDRRSGG